MQENNGAPDGYGQPRRRVRRYEEEETDLPQQRGSGERPRSDGSYGADYREPSRRPQGGGAQPLPNYATGRPEVDPGTWQGFLELLRSGGPSYEIGGGGHSRLNPPNRGQQYEPVTGGWDPQGQRRQQDYERAYGGADAPLNDQVLGMRNALSDSSFGRGQDWQSRPVVAGNAPSGFSFAGFDFNQDAANRNVNKSAKYGLAGALEQAQAQGASQQDAIRDPAAFANQYLKPYYEQLGYEWLGADRDKIMVRSREDEMGGLEPTWVDWIQGWDPATGAGEIAWQPDHGTMSGGMPGPANQLYMNAMDPSLSMPGLGTGVDSAGAPQVVDESSANQLLQYLLSLYGGQGLVPQGQQQNPNGYF